MPPKKFPGTSDAVLPEDSRYYVDVVPHPYLEYAELAADFKFHPESGLVDAVHEMPVEGQAPVAGQSDDRRALYTRGQTTVFHPLEARQTLYYGKRYSVPHRHAYFADRNDLREPRQRGTNRSLRNIEGMQPVVPFSDSDALMRIRSLVAAKVGKPESFFNFANANLYWAGEGSRLGAHKDQDHRSVLEVGPLTATVTLMAPGCDRFRRYVYKPDAAEHPLYQIEKLLPGSLNVLGRMANVKGTHEIPRQAKACARLSLNFRHVPADEPLAARQHHEAAPLAPRHRSRSPQRSRSPRRFPVLRAPPRQAIDLED